MLTDQSIKYVLDRLRLFEKYSAKKKLIPSLTCMRATLPHFRANDIQGVESRDCYIIQQ